MKRRELFALGAAAAVLPACKARAVAAASAGFHFDADRFASILATPARHRQCCASTKPASVLLDTMVATMYAYEYDLNEGAGTVHEVAVLYHPAAVTMALDDVAWNALLLPALPRLSSYYHTALDGLSTHGNPFFHAHHGIAVEDDASIEALVSRGCHFFACNNALYGLADSLGTALGQNGDRIHEKLLDSLVPGAMAVPSGVMAINACQEAHFTYLQVAL